MSTGDDYTSSGADRGEHDRGPVAGADPAPADTAEGADLEPASANVDYAAMGGLNIGAGPDYGATGAGIGIVDDMAANPDDSGAIDRDTTAHTGSGSDRGM